MGHVPMGWSKTSCQKSNWMYMNGSRELCKLHEFSTLVFEKIKYFNYYATIHNLFKLRNSIPNHF